MSDAQRSKGLEGVVAGSTTISNVEGTEGRLSYRGYLIQDLAANSSFEEVLYLLLNVELPTAAQLDDLDATMSERRELPEDAMVVLRALPKSGEPIDVQRTIVSTLALLDPDVNDTSREAVVVCPSRGFAVSLPQSVSPCFVCSRMLS